MGTILVTGATGNVGSSLVSELADRGVPARAFVRDPARAAAVLGPDVELAVGDFADPASIRVALDGVEVVFLACGNLPPQLAYETNVIDAAARAGVRRLVKLSALGAAPGSPGRLLGLARPDRAAPGGVGPPRGRPPAPLLHDQPARLRRGHPVGRGRVRPAEGVKVPMIDPRDVAATAAAVLTGDGHEGRTYELTGPESLTFSDVAAQVSELSGRPVRFVPVPDADALQGLLQAGLPDWLAENIVAVFAMLRQDPSPQVTDVIHALAGRQPRQLGQFLADHAALFR